MDEKGNDVESSVAAASVVDAELENRDIPHEISTTTATFDNKPTESKTPSTTASTAKSSALQPTIEQAHATLEQIVKENKTTKTFSKIEIDAIHVLLKEYDAVKDKVGKLKSLLGRSAKAQREAKVDLEATQKRLDQALREIDRLNKKVDKLANRPTHMELLADFEANFDRALLSVRHQSGGQETSSSSLDSFENFNSNNIKSNQHKDDTAVVDTLLMQELTESKTRIEKLENLNNALLHRSSQLETEAKERKKERDELKNKVTHLELEKRMAVMEAEHATKVMQEKAASLAEMQMEIELVTRASVKANARASQEAELLKTVRTDKQYVQQLEAQVQALQEWALAAAEAKTLSQERVHLLEAQLRGLKDSALITSEHERTIWTQKGSLVIGAGDVGLRVFEMQAEHIKELLLSERVVLRWKFDLTTEDRDVVFSITKGKCESPSNRSKAEYFIKDRAVKGGAEGETEQAFSVQNACTLLWSNEKSWIRPRTVKYTISAVAIAD